MASLKPVYLMVGEDVLKQEVALERLLARAEKDGATDFDIDERDAGTPGLDAELIVSSLLMLPMMAPYRLVVIENIDEGDKALTEALVSYLEDPSPTSVLALTAKKLGANTRLHKRIVSHGSDTIIDCSPKKQREVPEQVRDLAAQHGVGIDHRAVTELISRVGNSALALDREIEKIALNLGAGSTITVEDVTSLVVRSAEVKPWDPLDAFSERRASAFIELFERMPQQNPLSMLQLTLTRIRQLLTAKTLETRGTADSLASALGLQAWQVRNHRRWAQEWSTAELVDALRSGVEVELAMKSGDEQREAYRQWALGVLAGVRTPQSDGV